MLRPSSLAGFGVAWGLGSLAPLGCTAPPPVSVATRPAPPQAAPAGAPAPAPAGTAERSALLTCEEGPRRQVVELRGLSGGSPPAIFAALRAFELCHPEVFERDRLAIGLYYYDHGYVLADVPPPSIERSPDGTTVHARYDIHEGPRFAIRHYEIYEQQGEERTSPMGGFQPSLRAGDSFRRRAIAGDIDQLRRRYRDAGYADVDVQPQVEVDELRRETTVMVPIRRGDMHRFGRIEFAGLAQVSAAELQAVVAVAPGERFSESALVRAQQALGALGRFTRVDVVTHDGEAPDEVDVTFEVDERP